MNKKDLVNDIAYKTELTKKEIDNVLTSILEIIVNKVSEGERVRLVGFGSFYKSTKKLSVTFTQGNHPCETFTAKFSPGKFFKHRINVQN
jgi:DNA-binding protein HU-beta